jgi:hypothetical protein
MTLSNLYAQHNNTTCTIISGEAVQFDPEPMQGDFYWGVKVTSIVPVETQVTVEGYIHHEGYDYSTSNGNGAFFRLYIDAGQTTAQTDLDYFHISPNTSVEVTITSVSSCPGPSPVITPLTELYQGLDASILQSQDSVEIENYLSTKTVDIVNYVKATYGEDLDSICEGKADWIFMGGFIVAINEAYGQDGANGYDNTMKKITASPWANVSIAAIKSIGTLRNPFRPAWLSCAEAAMGIPALESLFSGYSTLLSGSITTAVGAFKNIAKRYLGWIGVAIAAYEFGDCMNWW